MSNAIITAAREWHLARSYARLCKAVRFNWDAYALAEPPCDRIGWGSNQPPQLNDERADENHPFIFLTQ